MENCGWRQSLAQNLSQLRREKGLTQAELGEKLNYSDKSVSKWERGEGVPDLNVLMQLSELYGVKLNDIIGIEDAIKKEDPLPHKERIVSHLYLLITMVSAVWLVALTVFLVLMLALPDPGKYWLSFIYALPVTFLSLGACFMCWRQWAWGFGAMSAALWTLCLSVGMTVNAQYSGIIFAIGGLIQLAAVFVIAVIVYTRKREKRHQTES